MERVVIVKKNRSGGWSVVKTRTSERHSTIHKTQAEAIRSAKRMTEKGGSVVVHNPSGHIREVLISKTKGFPRLREARVEHRRTDEEVNKAIARTLIGS